MKTKTKTKNHPLNNSWTLSLKLKSAQKHTASEEDWLAEYKKIYDFKTIEMFWRVYNNIPRWVELPFGHTYAYFKNNIKPSWEDPRNSHGFSMVLHLNKKMGMAVEACKNLERDAAMFMIGETVPDCNLINGITLERRYHNKIVIWCTYPEKTRDFRTLSAMANSYMRGIGLSPKSFTILQKNDKLTDPKFSKFSIMIKFVDHQKELKYNQEPKQ